MLAADARIIDAHVALARATDDVSSSARLKIAPALAPLSNVSVARSRGLGPFGTRLAASVADVTDVTSS